MGYKTILTHLPDDRRAPALMSLTLDIARAFDAHVIGAFVFPAHRITPPIPLPFGSDVAAQIRRAVAEDIDRTRKAFDAATKNQPVVCEWRAITSQRRDACDIVLEHARAADLVIVSQSDPDWDLTSILDFPALNLREAHERPEAMEEAAVMMVGLNVDRVLQGLKVLETQSRGQPGGSPARTLAPVADYHHPAVSEKVLRIILGYTDYVNRVVWRKA